MVLIDWNRRQAAWFAYPSGTKPAEAPAPQQRYPGSHRAGEENQIQFHDDLLAVDFSSKQMGKKINRKEVVVELYFAPLACSMATRIALDQAGASGRLCPSGTPQLKRLVDGSDLRSINAMEQVPVLATDHGELLTENPAVPRYVADQILNTGWPGERHGALSPTAAAELHHAQAAQGGVHRRSIPAAVTAPGASRDKATERFAYLNAQLRGDRNWSDRFTVADAYLVTQCSLWTRFSGLDLAHSPGSRWVFSRLSDDSSVARALA